jgi:hypothetical protein
VRDGAADDGAPWPDRGLDHRRHRLSEEGQAFRRGGPAIYCGQLGKQDNCQAAVSLSVANREASLPVRYRLYLPQEWADDTTRRGKAHVPDEIAFQTKPEIALEQIRWACAAGLPRGVVLLTQAMAITAPCARRSAPLG